MTEKAEPDKGRLPFRLREQQRHTNKLREGELEAQGWSPANDFPYKLAARFSLTVSASTLEAHLPRVIGSALEGNDQEYVRSNCERVGKKTWLSPALQEEVKKRILMQFQKVD